MTFPLEKDQPEIMIESNLIAMNTFDGHLNARVTLE